MRVRVVEGVRMRVVVREEVRMRVVVMRIRMNEEDGLGDGDRVRVVMGEGAIIKLTNSFSRFTLTCQNVCWLVDE